MNGEGYPGIWIDLHPRRQCNGGGIQSFRVLTGIESCQVNNRKVKIKDRFALYAHPERGQGPWIQFPVWQHGDRVNPQIEPAPVEHEILEHASCEVAVRLHFVLEMDQECPVLASKRCLDKQVPGPPLVVMSEKLLVHKLDMVEVDEGVDPGQKRSEEILEQPARLQQRLEKRIMIHQLM